MLRTLPRSKTPSGAAYLERGEGDEPLVLIHGVGMRAEAWQPQIERLANEFRVIAVDLPGLGFSDALEGVPELSSYVEWFRCFLKETETGPVNVAGHSIGGTDCRRHRCDGTRKGSTRCVVEWCASS